MIVTDVEEQPTHGGTLRVLIRKAGNGSASSRVFETINREKQYRNIATWQDYSHNLENWRDKFRDTIKSKRNEGKKIAGYAAASKATVLLNFVSLNSEVIEYCCDGSALKQGRYIPGVNIPIVPPSKLAEEEPDVIIVFAWNIFDEIKNVIAENISKPTEVINPLPKIQSTIITPGSAA